MSDEIKKEKYITPIAIGFMTTIVPDLLQQSFSAYKKRDFTKDYWQISDWEKWYAGAAIVLTASAIEANRNRVYHGYKQKISRNVVHDIANIFTSIKPLANFPEEYFTSLMGELFTVRDVIAHSHNYELDIEFRLSDWNMLDFRVKRINGYGNSKFNNLVDIDTFKTKLLGMNVLPTKIGFEELFMAILIFDLLVSIADKSFGKGYITYNILQKLDEYWVRNFCELLVYYYDKLPNHVFADHIIRLSHNLRGEFMDYIVDKDEYFITNVCPKCQTLGFRKKSYLYECYKCGTKIDIPAPNR